MSVWKHYCFSSEGTGLVETPSGQACGECGVVEGHAPTMTDLMVSPESIGDLPDTTPVGLTFAAFRKANARRCMKWRPEGIASWSPSDWLTAVTGELGELASLLKMRNRERDGLPGNKFSPTAKQVADELADVLTYLDLLAEVLGVDLGRAAVEKFNEVSERVGFSDRIEIATAPSPSAETAGGTEMLSEQERYDAHEWLEEYALTNANAKQALMSWNATAKERNDNGIECERLAGELAALRKMMEEADWELPSPFQAVLRVEGKYVGAISATEMHDAAAAVITKLRGENESLRADAERYRVFRDGNLDMEGICESLTLSGKDLDLALDAARLAPNEPLARGEVK